MLVKGLLKMKGYIVEEVATYVTIVFLLFPSMISRSNSFTSHDQLSISGRGRSRFRLSVNMGSYCTTEESNVSNCSLFIDDFVSLLTCVNERVGVKVCYCAYITVYMCMGIYMNVYVIESTQNDFCMFELSLQVLIFLHDGILWKQIHFEPGILASKLGLLKSGK